MRSSIFGTAQAAIWPWTNPQVAGSANGCDLTLEWLLSGNNTIYACAPLRSARRLAPALGGLVGDLLEQVAERVARTGVALDPPLLIVLDEVGNTPLRELPELVSTLSGLGVQIVTIWQFAVSNSGSSVRGSTRADQMPFVSTAATARM